MFGIDNKTKLGLGASDTILGSSLLPLTAVGVLKPSFNTGSDYFKAGVDSVFPGMGSIANTLTGGLLDKAFGSFHKSSSSKKKKKSFRTAKKYLNNAENLLNKQYDLGNDNTDLLSDYQNYLMDQYNNNKKYFYHKKEQNLLNNFVNDQTKKNQASLNNAFNQKFTGFDTTNDYLDDAWNMDYDDEFNTNYINDIYNDALSKIDSAKARGFLNDAGYSKALDLLNTRRSAGLSQLNEQTDKVLNNYRDDLADKAIKIKTGINKYTLGDRNTYNLDNLFDNYNNTLSSQQNKVTNDFNNALLSYTPFNASDILAEARNSQGVYNTNNDPELLNSLQEQANNKNKKIGLGNQGIF